MSKFENVNIDYLDKKEQNLWIELNYNELNSYFDDTFFDDLKNDKVKIKKYGNIYTFEQQDPLSSLLDDNNKFKITKFSVKEKVLDKYMKDQERKENKELDDDYNLIDFFNTISTSKDFWSLKNEVKDNIEKTNNSLESISSLISQYNKYSNLQKKDLWKTKTRDGNETLKDIKKEAKYRVKLLNAIKWDISNRSNTDVYQKDIDQCTTDIKAFEIAVQKAKLGDRWNVPRILHDKKRIKKYSVELQDDIIENQMINDVLHNITLKTLYNRDQLKFKEYLKDVISGKIEHPAQHPFYAEHKEDFQEIHNTNPALYGEYSWFMKPKKITRYCTTGPSGHPRNCSNKKESVRDKWGWLLVDGLAAAWIIDKNNPKQVEAIKKWGKWMMIAWAVFLWFKALSKVFAKSGTKNKRRDAALYGWWLFALFNADKLANWWKDVLGLDWKSNTVDRKKTSKETGLDVKDVDTYITPQYTTVAALWWTPINTLINQNFLTENNGKIDLDYDRYKNYIEWQKMDKKAAAIALENLEELKNNTDRLQNWLSSFGITELDQLKKISKDNDDMTLLDTKNVTDYVKGVNSSVNKDLNNEWLRPKDAASWYKIVWEFEENKTDNDKQIVWWMEAWLLEFTDDRWYKIEDMLKNENVNLLNKKMIWFDGVTFGWYSDLFGAVKLTDVIKEKFKKEWIASQAYNINNNEWPFHYWINTLWNIEFDDKEWYKIWENEKDVVNSNWFKNTLAEISPTLDQHKDEYIAYLNKRWKNKDNIW